MKLPDGITFERDPNPRRGMVRGVVKFTRVALARLAYNSPRAMQEIECPRERWRLAWRAARMAQT